MMMGMFWRVLLFVGLLAGGPPASAQTSSADALPFSTPQGRKDVIAVIDGQLAAFRAKQLDAAYAFAAPALRTQVPEAQFMQIVRSNYPEIWANVGADFGVVRDNGARATISVKVKTAQGGARYDYILMREGKAWRIGSVLRHVAKTDEPM